MIELNIKKKWLFFLAGVVLIFLSIEMISYIGLLVLMRRYHTVYNPADTISDWHAELINELLDDSSGYIKFSPELGWTIREFEKTQWYTANSAGMRSIKEYDFIPLADKFRIMVCGDGFIHCNDVKNRSTKTQKMDIMCGIHEYLANQKILDDPLIDGKSEIRVGFSITYHPR